MIFEMNLSALSFETAAARPPRDEALKAIIQ